MKLMIKGLIAFEQLYLKILSSYIEEFILWPFHFICISFQHYNSAIDTFLENGTFMLLTVQLIVFGCNKRARDKPISFVIVVVLYNCEKLPNLRI